MADKNTFDEIIQKRTDEEFGEAHRRFCEQVYKALRNFGAGVPRYVGNHLHPDGPAAKCLGQLTTPWADRHYPDEIVDKIRDRKTAELLSALNTATGPVPDIAADARAVEAKPVLVVEGERFVLHCDECGQAVHSGDLHDCPGPERGEQ